MSLRGHDLGGLDLRGVLLREADLSGANLAEVDLRGADLDRARVHNTTLAGADLRDASLDGVDLAAAVVRGARLDLSGAVQLARSLGAEVEYTQKPASRPVTGAGGGALLGALPEGALRWASGR